MGVLRIAAAARQGPGMAAGMGALVVAAGMVAIAGSGCAGAPWFLGDPLDGKPAIPPTSRAETVADHRRNMLEARNNGAKVIELAELAALEGRGALRAGERKRFGELLKERARDWAALKRPIPLAEDLRHLVALDGGRERSLAPALRAAERAAGDLWLSLGENARAEEEYRRAERRGAGSMVFRFRAAWGASPADLDEDVLERALADLPERALAPFTEAYLARGGAEPRVLRRAWAASRVYGPPALQLRLEALPAAGKFRDDGPRGVSTPVGVAVQPLAGAAAPDARIPTAPAPGDAKPEQEGPARAPRAAIRPSKVTVVAPADEDWLLSGPTLARVLLPLGEAFPDLTAPSVRSRAWADLLVAEDPTSPDSLEAAALIDARAGRLGGAARKLGDLVFYSPDRATGHARAAKVWERASQHRRACLAWEKAADSGPRDDPTWCALVACVERTTGVADVRSVTDYVRQRAPALPCLRPSEATAVATPDGGTPPLTSRSDAAPAD